MSILYTSPQSDFKPAPRPSALSTISARLRDFHASSEEIGSVASRKKAPLIGGGNLANNRLILV
jgi:hypothetical protein